MTRLLYTFILSLLLAAPLAGPGTAQDTTSDSGAASGGTQGDRAATGGAPTLEDILARQRGETVDNEFRRGTSEGAGESAPGLGPLGGVSDSDVWRDLRFNDANVKVSAGGDEAKVLVQDAGMAWLQFREGPLVTYGGWGLVAVLGLLVLFYLFRGKIRIDGEKTGRTVTRFAFIERFAHWLMAGSFIVLGITGLITLMGRKFIIPTFGHEAFSTVAIASKWIHNNISMAFVLWVVHNIPNKTDLKWLAVGGGIFTKGVHPPARKFNAGQKMIFWSVIILGASISASGLSLLFPFEMPMFAKTFAILNDTGLPQIVGLGVLPTDLPPHQEMQLAQAWHAIVSFVLMAIILAHIYMGSVEVEEQWAREHHGLWLEELQQKGQAPAPGKAPTPAE